MKKKITQQFGAKVKQLRVKHQLTQEELAHKSSVSLKYVQRIEGQKPPNVGIETIEKLAKGFEVPLFELFKF